MLTRQDRPDDSRTRATLFVPRRTYSLVRNRHPNESFRLVENQLESERNTLSGDTLVTPSLTPNQYGLGDYFIDSIHLNSFSAATTGIDVSKEYSETSANGESMILGGFPETAGDYISSTLWPPKLWSALSLDTDDFVPKVIPTWSGENSSAKPGASLSRNFGIRARIKKSRKGFIVRLLRHLTSGGEEIVDISMAKATEDGSEMTRRLHQRTHERSSSTAVSVDTVPVDLLETDMDQPLPEMDGRCVEPRELENTYFERYELDPSVSVPAATRIAAHMPSSPINVAHARGESDRSSVTLVGEETTNETIQTPILDLIRYENSLEVPSIGHSPQMRPLRSQFSFASSEHLSVIRQTSPDSKFMSNSSFHLGGSSIDFNRTASKEVSASPSIPYSHRQAVVMSRSRVSQPDAETSYLFEKLHSVPPKERKPECYNQLGASMTSIPDNQDRLSINSNQESIPSARFDEFQLLRGPWESGYWLGSEIGRPIQITRSQLVNFSILVVNTVLESLSKAMVSIVSSLDKSTTIPRGHVRIHWSCKCGKHLFDDFIEKRPGTALLLEQHLNRTHARPGGRDSSSSSTSHTSTHGQGSSSASQLTAPTSVETEARSTSIDQRSKSRYIPNLAARVSASTSNSSPLLEQLWVLACAERQKFTTKLLHLDAGSQSIKSDMDLARLLKREYASLRPSWKQFLRLRGLSTIQFVQFELHRSQAVDIRKCPDIPDRADLEYLYLPSDLIPPVGERYLMHLFHHPEDYEDETITYNRIPKKRGLKLRVGENDDVGVGWGIHLVEAFLPYKVWSFFTSFFVLISLVFAIAWAIKRGDAQGAFSIAAYICTLCTLAIGCCVAYLE